MDCKYCNIEMGVGFVIKPNIEEGYRYIKPNIEEGYRYIAWPGYINADTIIIVECWKCTECGHSEYINSSNMIV